MKRISWKSYQETQKKDPKTQPLGGGHSNRKTKKKEKNKEDLEIQEFNFIYDITTAGRGDTEGGFGERLN